MNPDRCNPTRLRSEEHRVQVTVLQVTVSITMMSSEHWKYTCTPDHEEAAKMRNILPAWLQMIVTDHILSACCLRVPVKTYLFAGTVSHRANKGIAPVNVDVRI